MTSESRLAADRCAVAVMARPPVEGQAKTRLARETGDAAAVHAYRRVLDETVETVLSIDEIRAVLALAPDGAAATGSAQASGSAEAAGSTAATSVWRPPSGMDVLPQEGEHLGERLFHVLDTLAGSEGAAIAIASDSPGLPRVFLERAVELLGCSGEGEPGGANVVGGNVIGEKMVGVDEVDMVLGPAFDGGYYLIGVTGDAWSRHRGSLADILPTGPLGTSRALDHTVAGARSAGMTVRLLPAWIDVDSADQLPFLDRLMTDADRGPVPHRDAAPPAGVTHQTVRRDGAVPLDPPRKHGDLREAYLHLTDRCGMSCPHCYLGDRPSNFAGELTTGEWRSVTDQAYEIGVRTFTFIGGDPLLRDDLPDLVDHVTTYDDTAVRLFFGRPLGDDGARTLARAGRGRLLPMLSIDGTAEINDRIRGPGSYEDAMNTLDALRRAGLAPGVNTVLLAPVLPVLGDMIDDLRRAGIRRLHLILPHERGRITADAAMIPDGRSLLESVRAARSAAIATGVALDNVQAWKSRLGRPRDLCSAGCSLVAVAATGDVHACPITCGDGAFLAGNVRDEPLARIWTTSPTLRLLREHHARDREPCADCRVIDACGGDCWVQGHYAARRAGRPAGYSAPSPYCDFLRPLFEELAGEVGEPTPTGNCHGNPLVDLAPFDCI